MTCEGCDEALEMGGMTWSVDVGDGAVELTGCEKHVNIVMKAVRAYEVGEMREVDRVGYALSEGPISGERIMGMTLLARNTVERCLDLLTERGHLREREGPFAMLSEKGGKRYQPTGERHDLH